VCLLPLVVALASWLSPPSPTAALADRASNSSGYAKLQDELSKLLGKNYTHTLLHGPAAPADGAVQSGPGRGDSGEAKEWAGTSQHVSQPSRQSRHQPTAHDQAGVGAAADEAVRQSRGSGRAGLVGFPRHQHAALDQAEDGAAAVAEEALWQSRDSAHVWTAGMPHHQRGVIGHAGSDGVASPDDEREATDMDTEQLPAKRHVDHSDVPSHSPELNGDSKRSASHAPPAAADEPSTSEEPRIATQDVEASLPANRHSGISGMQHRPTEPRSLGTGAHRSEPLQGVASLAEPPDDTSVATHAPETASLQSMIEAVMHVNYTAFPPVLETAFSEECAAHVSSARSLRDYVIVSDALKAVYIGNLKAGLIAMETYMKGYGKARWLHGVTAQSALALVDRGYTFFTFVRDPLTRLRSAYSETLYHTLRKPDRNHLPGFAKMKPSVAHLRYFMKKLRCCRSKFVKEVYHADAQYLYIGLGGPFTRESSRGMPPYSFIGRLETMERDWRYLLTQFLNVPEHKVKPIKQVHSSSTIGTHKKGPARVKAESTHVPVTDREVQLAACERYALDYKCLGYPLPPVCRSTVSATL